MSDCYWLGIQSHTIYCWRNVFSLFVFFYTCKDPKTCWTTRRAPSSPWWWILPCEAAQSNLKKALWWACDGVNANISVCVVSTNTTQIHVWVRFFTFFLINVLPLAFHPRFAGVYPCASPTVSPVFYIVHLPATHTNIHTDTIRSLHVISNITVGMVMIIRHFRYQTIIISSLTRFMYCTTSLTNDLLISNFSLWGEFDQTKLINGPNRAKSLVFSDI